MTRTARAALLLAAGWFAACDAPTSSTSLEVTLTPSPNPATAEPSSGVTYQVTNADSTVSVYAYDWRTSFTVAIQETGGLAVDITAVDLKVQQASAGIIITPSGGEAVYYKFTSSASGNHVAANGSASMGFTVWYDLPNQQREALITVTLAFKDDDDYAYSESVQVKVAP